MGEEERGERGKRERKGWDRERRENEGKWYKNMYL